MHPPSPTFTLLLRAARRLALALLLGARAMPAWADALQLLEIRQAGQVVPRVAGVLVQGPGQAEPTAQEVTRAQRFAAGTWIVVPARVELVLQTPDGAATLTLRPGTRYKVHAVLAQGQVHELADGTVLLEVKRQFDYFNVHFSHFLALVRGTTFSLTVDGTAQAGARVESGSVRVLAERTGRVGERQTIPDLLQVMRLQPQGQPSWQQSAPPDELRFGDAAAARAHFARALELALQQPDADTQLAARNDLGQALMAQNLGREAAEQFQLGLQQARTLRDVPWQARMANNLGAALLVDGQPEAAERQLRQALALNRELYPDGISLRLAGNFTNLGLALQRQAPPQDRENAQAQEAAALAAFEQAWGVHSRLQPPARRATRSGALTNLGNLLVGGSRLPALCEGASGAAPDVVAARERVRQGQLWLEMALEIDQQEDTPAARADQARDHINLGVAQLRLCRPDLAEAAFERALRLREALYPDGRSAELAQAHRALALALARQGGRTAEAAAQQALAGAIERALREAPPAR